MSEVTKLSVVSGVAVNDAKKAMLKRFDTDVAAMRKWLEEVDTGGGYALIAYHVQKRESEPQVESWVNYFCMHPADAFWLPDMAKTRVWQRAHDK